MKNLWLAVVFAAASTVVLPTDEAAGQWNNAPYQPSFRGPSAGVGMSPGYRQIILLDRLTEGVSRNNLHRLPSGLLSDVTRKDGQAFLSVDGMPVGPTRSITRRSGFGYGGMSGYFHSYATSATYRQGLHGSIAFNGWWPIVSDAGSPAATSASFSVSPIDGWISQLDSL